MKNIISTILLLFLITPSISKGMSVKNYKSAPLKQLSNKYPELDFIELKQPTGDHKAKFDLSGLAIDNNNVIYTISDKQKNHFIYNLDWKTSKLIPFLDFGIKTRLDVEAIDVCEDEFYISNEKDNKFYIIKKDSPLRIISPDYSSIGEKRNFFNSNRGFEGLAVDCKNQILYAAKERQPRYILTINIKTQKILKKWDIPEIDAFDYSDAKFENDHLYLLERTGMLVTKINIKTEKVIAKFSYKNIEKHYGYLYGPAIYPFAEALLLTEDEIWIGFDNNGLRVTNQASKDLGIKGRDPIVMRFKRPANF